MRFDGLPTLTSLASGSTDSLALASNNHDTSLRRNTVLSLSPDNGATWPAKLLLCPGSSAYSTAARLPDGNIGVLYERQGYRKLYSFPSPPGSLQTSSRPPGKPLRRAARPGLVFHMELRSITPGRPAVWQNAGEFHIISADGGDWGSRPGKRSVRAIQQTWRR